MPGRAGPGCDLQESPHLGECSGNLVGERVDLRPGLLADFQRVRHCVSDSPWPVASPAASLWAPGEERARRAAIRPCTSATGTAPRGKLPGGQSLLGPGKHFPVAVQAQGRGGSGGSPPHRECLEHGSQVQVSGGLGHAGLPCRVEQRDVLGSQGGSDLRWRSVSERHTTQARAVHRCCRHRRQPTGSPQTATPGRLTTRTCAPKTQPDEAV